MDNNGGDAFPMANVSDIYPGMTLHQWYAGMALQGIISTVNFRGSETWKDRAVSESIYIADAMLAAYKEKMND